MSNELLDPRLPPLVRIVDDDDRVRQSEAFVLRLEGFDVREYSSAEDFLHFDDVSRAGCIVLDIRMPGMNGLELQSELLRTGRSLPILFLTGHGDVAMAVDALKRGAADFIQKPVMPLFAFMRMKPLSSSTCNWCLTDDGLLSPAASPISRNEGANPCSTRCFLMAPSTLR